MSDILLFPIRLLWGLLTGILNLTGRLILIVLALSFLVIGFALTVTVIGAILGIPLIIFGLALLLRGLF